MSIPLVDLKRQYSGIKEEIDRNIHSVLDSASFILGSCGSKFEGEFATFCGAEAAVGLSSGTDALTLALMALDIGRGDEVLIPANTFIATAGAVSHAGARPVLVDIDPETYNLDTTGIEPEITGKTRAIIPVHLYGQPADIDEVLRIARKHDLKVIEDACQAHGAEYKGRRVGSLADISAFSFYPGKNLGAYGDGGAIVTNSRDLTDKVKLLRNHGSLKKYYHEIIGYNSRLDEIQAAVLSAKLPYLNQWNEQRRENAAIYARCLQELVGEGLVVTPKESDWAKHIYHLFVIQVAEEVRDSLIEHLNSVGIGASIHYPVPIHFQKAYQHLGYKEGDFPVTEKIAKRIVSLPMFPELEVHEIEQVARQIELFLRRANNWNCCPQAVSL